MAVVFVEGGREATEIPYPSKYALIASRLTASQMDAIKSALNDKIDGTDIQTAGWNARRGLDWHRVPAHLRVGRPAES